MYLCIVQLQGAYSPKTFKAPEQVQQINRERSKMTTNEGKNMNIIENTKAQMRKGVLEFCILSAMSEKELYPTEIIDRLKQAKLVVVEGTLYPLLTRLKNLGLLTYRWEESTSGPPRKYYRLTELGTQFLQELQTSWDDLVKAVYSVTKPTPNSTPNE